MDILDEIIQGSHKFVVKYRISPKIVYLGENEWWKLKSLFYTELSNLTQVQHDSIMRKKEVAGMKLIIVDKENYLNYGP